MAGFYQRGYEAGYHGGSSALPEGASTRGLNLFLGGLYDGELQWKLERARAMGDEETIAHCEHNQRRRARGG